MIVYFSGTGNSLLVASELSSRLSDRLYSMEGPCLEMPSLTDDEALGIVFPVYAWGLPQIVTEFLAQMRVEERYVWAVMTCGDDMGYADRILERTLGHSVKAAFSVRMPNTYVNLPGFHVDAPELARQKVLETQLVLPQIAAKVMARSSARELTRGAMPWLKTYVVRPLFNRYLVTDKHFKTSADCTACGLCAKQCPLQDIAMERGTPVWQHTACTGCLRCYHNCPKRAIDWGRYTKGKGQKDMPQW